MLTIIVIEITSSASTSSAKVRQQCCSGIQVESKVMLLYLDHLRSVHEPKTDYAIYA